MLPRKAVYRMIICIITCYSNVSERASPPPNSDQQQLSQSRPQSPAGTGNRNQRTGSEAGPETNEEQQTTPCPLCQEPYSEYSELESHVMQIHSVNSDGLQRLLVLMEGKN